MAAGPEPIAAPGERSRARRSFAAHPLVWDTALMLVALGLAVSSTVVNTRITEINDLPGPSMRDSVLWTLALVLPLAMRRRLPATSFVATSVVFAVFRRIEVAEASASTFVYFVSLASAGIWISSPRRRLWVRLGGVTLSTLTLIDGVVRLETPPEYEGIITAALAITLAFNLAFFAAGWVVGDMFRTRREREAELLDRTRQLEFERELRARRAVQDERIRISRELHDVVAHHVSVMGVQAGGARRVLSRDPDAAVAALGTIEQSSRQAIDELRRLVGFLRTDDDGDSLMPQPGIERLGELFDDAVRSGLRVEHRVEGDPRPVAGSVDVSVYRVVQEALTNTRKHAGASRADVVLRYTTEAVEVEIVDDGTAALSTSSTADGRGTGHGLLGMRERVALHGGELVTGRSGVHGFRVAARFPAKEAS